MAKRDAAEKAELLEVAAGPGQRQIGGGDDIDGGEVPGFGSNEETSVTKKPKEDGD